MAFQGSAVAQDTSIDQREMSDAAPRVPQSLLLSFLAGKASFTLIDARSIDEFTASHLNGAINLPHDAAFESNEQLPADLKEPIVVYCKTGKRANALQQRLREHGYTDVQLLQPEQITWFDGMAVFNCGVPSSQEPANALTSNRDSGSREET